MRRRPGTGRGVMLIHDLTVLGVMRIYVGQAGVQDTS